MALRGHPSISPGAGAGRAAEDHLLKPAQEERRAGRDPQVQRRRAPGPFPRQWARRRPGCRPAPARPRRPVPHAAHARPERACAVRGEAEDRAVPVLRPGLPASARGGGGVGARGITGSAGSLLWGRVVAGVRRAPDKVSVQTRSFSGGASSGSHLLGKTA